VRAPAEKTILGAVHKVRHAKKFKSMMSHPSVTNCHTISESLPPLERDVAYVMDGPLFSVKRQTNLFSQWI